MKSYLFLEHRLVVKGKVLSQLESSFDFYNCRTLTSIDPDDEFDQSDKTYHS